MRIKVGMLFQINWGTIPSGRFPEKVAEDLVVVNRITPKPAYGREFYVNFESIASIKPTKCRQFTLSEKGFRSIVVKKVDFKDLPLYMGWHCTKNFQELIQQGPSFL